MRRDDNAIFPETLLDAMQADGYMQSADDGWLGYVYVDSGVIPAIQ